MIIVSHFLNFQIKLLNNKKIKILKKKINIDTKNYKICMMNNIIYFI